MPGNAWARKCTGNSRKREWPDKKQDLYRGLTDQLFCPDPWRCSPGTQRSPSRRSSFFQIGTPALIASMINREPSYASVTMLRAHDDDKDVLSDGKSADPVDNINGEEVVGLFCL